MSKRCPNCRRESLIHSGHGDYCADTRCKWGWECEFPAPPAAPQSDQPAQGPRKLAELWIEADDFIAKHSAIESEQMVRFLTTLHCKCGAEFTADNQGAMTDMFVRHVVMEAFTVAAPAVQPSAPRLNAENIRRAIDVYTRNGKTEWDSVSDLLNAVASAVPSSGADARELAEKLWAMGPDSVSHSKWVAWATALLESFHAQARLAGWYEGCASDFTIFWSEIVMASDDKLTVDAQQAKQKVLDTIKPYVESFRAETLERAAQVVKQLFDSIADEGPTDRRIVLAQALKDIRALSPSPNWLARQIAEGQRQKEITVSKHIIGGALDGCMCEPCIAARKLVIGEHKSSCPQCQESERRKREGKTWAIVCERLAALESTLKP